ncbi:hypothetical protein M569_03672, partial [Genlisea aurea]
LVPAIIIFGDSAVDTGNNDYIPTVFRADHPPYGRDFKNKLPTGRFSNGKLVTDLTADTLGFTSYPAAYLGPEASGKRLLVGANFASAGSGYDERTALLSSVIPLNQQLEYFKEYKGKLASVAGGEKAAGDIIKSALYIASFGSSDFVQNYYINPLLNKLVSSDDYSSYLITVFSGFIESLYSEGARRIGVNSLPPLGCLPIAKTLFGFGQPGCVSRFNSDAVSFNRKLNAAAEQLKKQLPGLKLAVFDIYKPLLDLITKPGDNGFTESSKGCCGTGTIETTSLLCNQVSIGTCSNATTYVFWDSVHPTEAAYSVLANDLIFQGIALI